MNQILVFWVVTPWGLVDCQQRFGKTCCTHLLSRSKYNPDGGEKTSGDLKYLTQLSASEGLVLWWYKVFPLLSCYTGQGNSKRTFRGYLSVQSSRIKQFSWTAWPLKMGQTGSSETSVSNRLTLRNNPEDGRCQKISFNFVAVKASILISFWRN
jgi:hypothetical protein